MSETFFVKHQKKDKFTILDKTCVNDTRLSWKAKGLHTYLMSLPDDWQIYLMEISTHSSDGKASLYAGISELINLGYIIKVQKRSENGRFGSTHYYVFENPEDAASFDILELEESDENTVSSPLSTFPHPEKPYTGKPVPENRTLLTTNKLNTKRQNTELTNYDSQKVSESVFVNLIKNLFSGDYPFDRNFESDVLKKLEAGNVEVAETGNLKSYLNYVFERTKAANPSRSFEGLYRKLALSNSIMMDFKLSNQYQKNEIQEPEKTRRAIKYITCSICGSQFDELDFYCPACGVSRKAINGEDKTEYTVHKKLFGMTDEEKQKYEQAYSLWEEQTIKQTGRPFVLANEKIQFWKDYGILPEKTEED